MLFILYLLWDPESESESESESEFVSEQEQPHHDYSPLVRSAMSIEKSDK